MPYKWPSSWKKKKLQKQIFYQNMTISSDTDAYILSTF